MKSSIPIGEVFRRYTRAKPQLGLYPLYQNYKEHFDFKNVLQSVDNWLSYTGNEQKAFTKVLELFDITSKKGFEENAKLLTNRITSICMNLENPDNFRPTVQKWIKESSGTQKTNLIAIYDALSEAVQCDRVIDNHNRFSKRFNIDSYVRENATDGESVAETIYEICSFIDTYKLGIDSKFSLSLEEAMFVFCKNNIIVSPETIVESVTDYFLSNHLKADDSRREILGIFEAVIDKNRFVSANESSYLTSLNEAVNEEAIDESVLLEQSLKDKTKDLILKFKALPGKSETAFKSLITNLLVVNKDNNMVDGSKNVLSIIFYFVIVVGAFSVGMIPGLLSLVVTKTINFVAERKYYDKVLKTWYSHRDSVARKMDKCKDPEKKKKFEGYLKEIDKSIDKLETHSDSMRGDDEKKSYENHPSGYTRKDDDLDDFNFNFDEEAKQCALNIGIIAEGVSSIVWDKDKVQSVLFSSEVIPNIKLEDVDYLVNFTTKYHMLDENAFIEALKYANNVVSKEHGYTKYTKQSFYAEAIATLTKSRDDYDFSGTLDTDPEDDEIFSDINAIYEATTNINSYVSCINELSLTSNLTLAVTKLTKKMYDLSDKEKIASRSIDAACRILKRNVEKAMTMENREAVIRGDILPPASKIIKIALITGTAALIHPAIAVVMLLTRFAMCARIRIKERQLVLNELEVENKMVEKYIADAEEKKDYKKLRELLLIQKKLQAQEARLRYKIKIEWDDKSVHTGDKDDD